MSRPNSPTPETSSTSKIRVVAWDDVEALKRLAKKISEPKIVKGFWEDSLRQDPLMSFGLLFMNPFNLVIDLDGDGVIILTHIFPGWRATMHAATWGPKATRKRKLWRTALAAAMELKGLHELDAVTSSTNRAAHIGLRLAGFRKQGVFPGSMWYDGVQSDGWWYRLHRTDLGLEPIEGLHG